jgi:hypothetical protein
MGLFEKKWKLIIGCTKKMGQFFTTVWFWNWKVRHGGKHATQSARRGHQVQHLPRKVNVDVTKRQACHAK